MIGPQDQSRGAPGPSHPPGPVPATAGPTTPPTAAGSPADPPAALPAAADDPLLELELLVPAAFFAALVTFFGTFTLAHRLGKVSQCDHNSASPPASTALEASGLGCTTLRSSVILTFLSGIGGGGIGDCMARRSAECLEEEGVYGVEAPAPGFGVLWPVSSSVLEWATDPPSP